MKKAKLFNSTEKKKADRLVRSAFSNSSRRTLSTLLLTLQQFLVMNAVARPGPQFETLPANEIPRALADPVRSLVELPQSPVDLEQKLSLLVRQLQKIRLLRFPTRLIHLIGKSSLGVSHTIAMTLETLMNLVGLGLELLTEAAQFGARQFLVVIVIIHKLSSIVLCHVRSPFDRTCEVHELIPTQNLSVVARPPESESIPRRRERPHFAEVCPLSSTPVLHAHPKGPPLLPEPPSIMMAFRFSHRRSTEFTMTRRPPPPSSTTPKQGRERFEPIRSIRVRGARENNLRDVDIDIPRDVLTVMTGLSGSGKSSLAFETIFAEGQRKYMESLSAYARQFLNQLSKPDVESIDGLTPTIAIEQRAAGRNPRSTVATTTEIYDYLRLLFARVGEPRCWSPGKKRRGTRIPTRCSARITRANTALIHEAIHTLPEGTRLLVLGPVVRARKGHHRDVLESLARDGLVRARVNGAIRVLEDVLRDGSENPLELGRYEKHDVEAVVDRLVVRPDARARLADSVETALRIGKGVVIISVETDGEWADTIYSEHHACAIHPESALDELEPRLFSFNSHAGACEHCQGLGEILEFDDDLVLPDADKTLGKGGIAPWKRNGPAGMFANRYIRRFCEGAMVARDTRIGDLPDDLRRILLHGTPPEDIPEHGFEWVGVIPQLSKWFQETDSRWAREFLPQFMRASTCTHCAGARLNIKALSVGLETRASLPKALLARRKKHGLEATPERFNISDFCHLDIQSALDVIEGLVLGENAKTIAEPIVVEIRARLGFLSSVGLEYLSLDRKTGSLSGGEAQRIRLASQVGSGIVGATYVLDEPTIGLHARDNARLIRTLRHLADIGNTVLVVEHDEEMIRAADHIIDIGPGPGVHGGQIVATGTLDDLKNCAESLTGKYLSGALSVPCPRPSERRQMDVERALIVRGARQHNLRGVDVAFPLGGLLCVTGVSGSGKSTLVNGILLQAAGQHLGRTRMHPGEHDAVEGLDAIDRIIEVDQSPIGRTPRSNPATYTDMFNDIRSLFALTNEARMRGYKAGRFSFNVKGGRCEVCKGQGTRKVAMHFLPDVFVICESCEGTRFNTETLEVRYRDKNIAEVLAMTIEEACTFFENHPKIARLARCLSSVGLDYITLGQPANTLSGGEAQRVKLATELGKGPGIRSGHTLYVLDEPTTGLHFHDVAKLIRVLHDLVDQGNTAVVIEHNLDVIKSADWIVDMGPDGGSGGGRVVAEGPPETIIRRKKSHTAQCLKPLLSS